MVQFTCCKMNLKKKEQVEEVVEEEVLDYSRLTRTKPGLRMKIIPKYDEKPGVHHNHPRPQTASAVTAARRSLNKLMAEREKRVKPSTDQKVLARRKSYGKGCSSSRRVSEGGCFKGKRGRDTRSMSDGVLLLRRNDSISPGGGGTGRKDDGKLLKGRETGEEEKMLEGWKEVERREVQKWVDGDEWKEVEGRDVQKWVDEEKWVEMKGGKEKKVMEEGKWRGMKGREERIGVDDGEWDEVEGGKEEQWVEEEEWEEVVGREQKEGVEKEGEVEDVEVGHVEEQELHADWEGLEEEKEKRKEKDKKKKKREGEKKERTKEKISPHLEEKRDAKRRSGGARREVKEDGKKEPTIHKHEVRCFNSTCGVACA